MVTTRASRKSALERQQDSAAIRDELPAVIALVAAEVTVGAIDLDAHRQSWHAAVALVPVLPAIWLGWAQLRSIRRSDEYQRTRQLEALAIGFGAAMLVLLIGELLHAANVGSGVQFLQITFVAGIISWVTALAVRLRR